MRLIRLELLWEQEGMGFKNKTPSLDSKLEKCCLCLKLLNG